MLNLQVENRQTLKLAATQVDLQSLTDQLELQTLSERMLFLAT